MPFVSGLPPALVSLLLWTDVPPTSELPRALALRVARDYDPELVVGVARAGVIPGAVVALIIRVDFHSMNISRRDGGEQVHESPAIMSSAPASSRD